MSRFRSKKNKLNGPFRSKKNKLNRFSFRSKKNKFNGSSFRSKKTKLNGYSFRSKKKQNAPACILVVNKKPLEEAMEREREGGGAFFSNNKSPPLILTFLPLLKNTPCFGNPHSQTCKRRRPGRTCAPRSPLVGRPVRESSNQTQHPLSSPIGRVNNNVATGKKSISVNCIRGYQGATAAN